MFARITYVIFGTVLVVVEEFVIGYGTYTNIRKKELETALKKAEQGASFEELANDEQKSISRYYESVNNTMDERMRIMARESSIQQEL